MLLLSCKHRLFPWLFLVLTSSPVAVCRRACAQPAIEQTPANKRTISSHPHAFAAPVLVERSVMRYVEAAPAYLTCTPAPHAQLAHHNHNQRGPSDPPPEAAPTRIGVPLGEHGLMARGDKMCSCWGLHLHTGGGFSLHTSTLVSPPLSTPQHLLSPHMRLWPDFSPMCLLFSVRLVECQCDVWPKSFR